MGKIEHWIQFSPINQAWFLIFGDRKKPIQTWEVLQIFNYKDEAEWELKRIKGEI